MKIKTTIIAIIVAVLLGVGATTVVLVNLDNEPKANESGSQQIVQDQPDGTVIRFTAESNKSVLEQLTAREAVETKDSQYGVYVETINGKKGGDGGKYWTFYVDGKMAEVGAGAYITKGGEAIEWKFE